MRKKKKVGPVRRVKWRDWDGILVDDQLVEYDPDRIVLIRDGVLIIVCDEWVEVRP